MHSFFMFKETVVIQKLWIIYEIYIYKINTYKYVLYQFLLSIILLKYNTKG